MSPLFIVLKETHGQFGPRVLENLYRPSNVYIEASASGKLSKDLLQTWLQTVFLPYSGKSPVLLLDSWSGQCEKTVKEAVPSGMNLIFKTIPQGTTGQIQPLDVYGFRFWKNFVRKLSDIIILMDYDVNLHKQNNLIKMQSLTHRQFSSPRFKDVFKYSWYKSGYLQERPPKFENPVDYCLHTDEEPVCDICGDIAIIRCAWCQKQLCLKHFFTDNHDCKEYVP